jgi:hypothetical protein
MISTKTKLNQCGFILITFICSFLTIAANSQDKLPIKFGKVSLGDFEIKSAIVDSNTNAVVISDVGISEFVANTTDLTFSLMFKHKKRIKLINKNGFDAASISIPLFIADDGREEKLENFSAYTYNIENGKVVETKLEKDALFSEKETKNWTNKKFTFPAIKEGSIIEFSYQVKSPFFFNFQSWDFQGAYPVLWSQYEASIPEFFKYVISSQGYQPFAVNKVDQSQASFAFTERAYSTLDRSYRPFFREGVSDVDNFKIEAFVDYHTWIMKDVPSLKVEPFTTTVNNSISKVEFELKQVAYRHTKPEIYMNTWERVSKDMLEAENFGLQIKSVNNWLDEEVKSLIKNEATPIEKAKKLYDYVRDNFTCTNFNRYRITSTLKEVYKTKTGSVADINMLLIAMLSSQNIAADPIILSTRSHGITNPYYPLMDKYNYVIVRVNIDNTIYNLDATQPRLAFGKLPLQAYNGHARLLNKMAIPVYFEADSLTESNNTTVFISNMEKGGIEGAFINQMGYYHSLDFRNTIAKITITEYKKKLTAAYPDEIKISNIQIDSLTHLDDPIELKYDLVLKAFDEASIVYFNPLMGEEIKKNPFVATERYYPVEMSYAQDDTYMLNMEIPKGYMVDELPKSARLMLNENEGMFEYLITNNGESIQIRCKVLIKKAKFINEDYQTLRDFYAFIVNKEAEQIVFKKVK